jgi:Contractile injection system tube protein/LysM domain
MSLEKAYLLNLDLATPGSKPSGIPFMFNPKEYTFSKSNRWTGGGTPGKAPESGGAQKNSPELQFEGGEASSLKMQLFFDTYHQSTSPGSARDVRKLTEEIWALMYVSDKKRDKTQFTRPPLVKFMWGKTWTFDAVIESISQQFTMFLPDGTPVRAILDVSFRQVKDEHQLRAQNPTSGGIGGERMWRVEDGDTLARIAHETLGSDAHWRMIAAANQINDVRDLKLGSVLIIPT